MCNGQKLSRHMDYAARRHRFSRPAARADDPELERGTTVVARMANFVLRDGEKVIQPNSPYAIYRVQLVEGDGLRLYSHGREGDARVIDVVQLEKAEAYFSEQLTAQPRDVYGYLMRCTIRLQRRDLANALADCEAARHLDANNPRVYLLRGDLKYELADKNNALRDYDEAIRLDEKIAESYIRRAYFHLDGKHYGKALADLNEAIRIDPKDITIYLARSEIWNDKHDDRRELEELDKAIRLDPENATARVARHLHYESRHDVEKALADLNEAIRLDPGYGDAYFMRTMVIKNPDAPGNAYSRSRPRNPP